MRDKKNLFWIFIVFFPALVFADGQSTLNFNPPPGDFSVVFLSNIFGIVEGVLHGTGSQVMGNMMAVFNSAVMALGSILIMYTLVVGTMNTAHEGQFLGQKWASIWVPMRSVFGMSLLVPQSSGYCMMQIFVMWVVVQGVGAADKIWSTTLDYLNRGGVLIQSQMAPPISLTAANNEIATGAATILQAQVCMLSLQRILEGIREITLQTAQSTKSGFCYNPPGDTPQQGFCQQAVPDFISSVDAVSYQKDAGDATSIYSLDMPHKLPGVYAGLQGICGTIKWNNLAQTNKQFDRLTTYQDAANQQSSSTQLSISADDLKTAKLSRAIAIQQMYVDLAVIAQAMVSNSPLLYPSAHPDDPSYAIPFFARDQFGIPLTDQGIPCQSVNTCVSWGADPHVPGNGSSPAPVLFNGAEFQGAVSDYNAIMLPTLRLLKEAKNAASQSDARHFIFKAEQSGWLMAGSYFFDLARLNAQGQGMSDLTDSDTGLAQSISPIEVLASIYNRGGECGGKFSMICQWTQQNSTMINEIISLINGDKLNGLSSPVPLNVGGQSLIPQVPIDGIASTTVVGFINNSSLVQLPGQPGLNPPQFAMHVNIPSVNANPFSLPGQDFGCDHWYQIGCWAEQGLYNAAQFIINILMTFVLNLVSQLLLIIISTPLLELSHVFIHAVSLIQQPTVNPIVSLANMGANFINVGTSMWLNLALIVTLAGAIPFGIGTAIMILAALVMPFIAAWLTTMVMIGFLTAYYIPFLPYMIFTFGTIGWLMAVIEAMVAAPIVALGVCFPEGHEAFGKAEASVMILMNVFLRPAMMMLGFISAIILSYVAVWVINSGFANAILFMQGNPDQPAYSGWSNMNPMGTLEQGKEVITQGMNGNGAVNTTGSGSSAADQAGQIDLIHGYSSWAGVFGFFMSILLYVMMYLTVVQESFNLITMLPDKVLRWIGGQAETIGAETGKWTEQAKGQITEAGKTTAAASQQAGAKLQDVIKERISKQSEEGGTVSGGGT